MAHPGLVVKCISQGISLAWMYRTGSPEGPHNIWDKEGMCVGSREHVFVLLEIGLASY